MAAGDVLGQIDQHRPGTAAGRQVKRFAHDARDVVGVLHQVGMLHHRVGDPGDVGFLEGVLAQHRRDGLPGEHDHRHRVHERGQQAGHGVGGARSRGHQHHARFTGGTRVAVGHVGGALLVAHQDQLDLGIDQRIEHRHGGATGKSKDVLDPFALQAADQAFPRRWGRPPQGQASRGPVTGWAPWPRWAQACWAGGLGSRFEM